MSGYQIVDEPQPSRWNHLVVQPLWPLFGLMFAGSWLSFIWFVVNGQAMGCPYRKKTLVVALIGFAGRFVLVGSIFVFAAMFEWDGFHIRYAFLAATVWNLGIGYYLYVLQSRSFELYRYFGGLVRNGIWVVFLGYYLGSRLLSGLPVFLQVVLH